MKYSLKEPNVAAYAILAEEAVTNMLTTQAEDNILQFKVSGQDENAKALHRAILQACKNHEAEFKHPPAISAPDLEPAKATVKPKK